MSIRVKKPQPTKRQIVLLIAFLVAVSLGMTFGLVWTACNLILPLLGIAAPNTFRVFGLTLLIWGVAVGVKTYIAARRSRG